MHLSARTGFAPLLDGLARLVLIGTMALMPIFAVPLSWISLAQSKMLFLSVALLLAALLWMSARLFEGSIRLPRGPLLYAALFLPAAYIASAAATGFATRSVFGVGVEQDTLAAVIIWFAVFALAAILFHDHTAGLRASIRALAVGLCALFAIQVGYVFFPGLFSLGGFLQGPTANLAGSWHDLGILAGLALAGGVMLFHSSVFAGRWRMLALGLSVAAFFMLMLVHFADVLWAVAAFMAAAWFSALWAHMRTGLSLKSALSRSLVPLILALVLAGGAALGGALWEKLPARISITEIEVRPSWQGTFDVGRQSLDAPQQVFFGTGPNSFVREWGLHKPSGVNTTPYWNADFTYGIGIIPTSAFTTGVIGLIAWGAIVLALLALVVRFFRDPRPLVGFLLFGSLYAIGFHMLYTPGIALSAMTFILMGLLAAAVAAGEKAERVLAARTTGGSVAFALVILSAVPIVIAAGLVGKEIVSNIAVNRAVAVYRSTGDVGGAGKALETALILSPRNDRAHRAAAELGLVELAQLLSRGAPQTDEARALLQETLQATIQHGLTAVQIDERNYQNWLLLAQVYGSLAGANVSGAYEEAKSTYEKAFEASPTNPLPKLRLAQLAAARNDLPAARTYLSEAIAIKQDFAAAYFLLSQVEAAEGNLDAAAEAAGAAVQLVPNDPLGWFNLGQILYLKKSYPDAAVVLEQAVGRANDYSDALLYLGASYYQLGRLGEAIAALERVAALNPDEIGVQEALARLRAGGDPFGAGAAE